jgi:hypothetical protein
MAPLRTIGLKRVKLTRRELLTTFLGAPIALAACSKNAPAFPVGEIVGQSVELGHILREPREWSIAEDKWQSIDVAIVGAGIAGLSAARKLIKNGVDDLVILELEKAAGGTARSGEGSPVPYPWGAHYLPVPFEENKDLIELLDEMDIFESKGSREVREEFLCREPEERVFYKGRWYEGLYLHAGESEDDRREFERFQAGLNKWIEWRDAAGKRAFALPVAECSRDEAVISLDKISFGEWLRQNGFSSERLFWYCDYACRDDYGSNLDQTSAWAGLFYFCSRVKKTGDESQPFITFPEGNGRFVNHLRGMTGDRRRTSSIAVSVEKKENGVDVVYLENGEPRGFRCKHAVFAAPMFTAPYLIRGFREAAPFDAAAFEHNSWFVANLFLKDRPKPRFAKDFPLAWDNVLYESPSLGYVTATHQKGIDYGPTILTYYYPMCREANARTTLFNYNWRELADVCLTDISLAHPDIYELTTRIDIMRWGHAMISPRPNFIWSGVREKAMQPFGNIHFAHTDLSGIALFEEAFYHGIRAAGEIVNK